MKSLITPLLLVAAAGCLHRSPSLPAPIPKVEGEQRVAFALRYTDVRLGAGAVLQPRHCVFAHYTGWLTDGKKFDSSRDTTNAGKPRDPISFPQGARRVIAGWDLGFDG